MDMSMSAVDLALEEPNALSISAANLVVGVRGIMSGRASHTDPNALADHANCLGGAHTHTLARASSTIDHLFS